ncbi:DUF2252 domain-containing protein [Nocardioides sp. zg-1308]|uniref:DUF2252 domain-containing protein n=1 Tax=Nocardioides sp. zg-1308 TaxID=2736253 RepID=UPI001552301D|nr:DUF2252 domain-containing protein [Nocardioides sp. zg-1308]NPD06544.1 DUF2252 domain-containing protein [Nocardioides sp. zg-1308]
MVTAGPERRTVEERTALGKRSRERAPRSGQAAWAPPPDRVDPVALLEEQGLTREQDLLPVRYGRMMASAFTFYRGAAKIMAADLRHTDTAGLDAQLCGDTHLSNFGMFASPERILLIDLNDFDETLPGPFEYDVKRLATSVTIAARHNGLTEDEAREATSASVTAYRTAMTEFAGMRTLDVWYARRSERDFSAALAEAAESQTDKNRRKVVREASRATAKAVRKARTRDSSQALAKLAEHVDGSYRIASRPPNIVPARELSGVMGVSSTELQSAIETQFAAYRASLPDDRRHLLDRFELVDVARKVGGVGSVGTRTYIALLQGRDERDPLFLQVKEATRSVLEDHLPASGYDQPGERVVRGQRMMQAASDIFLGWAPGVETDRHYYWRQLRDMNASADVESMAGPVLTLYARECGWTLARAHARSGDPVAISAYLGRGDDFDGAVTEFASAYADQNERDFDEFRQAVRSGRLAATDGV